MEKIEREGGLLMDAKGELEKVIKKSCLWFIADPGKNSSVGSELARAILNKLPELGFVRLEDVEIDEDRLFEIMNDILPVKYTYQVLLSTNQFKIFATAIAEAKGIIKAKEAKK